MAYLCTLFSPEDSCNEWLFCGKRETCKMRLPAGLQRVRERGREPKKEGER